MNEQPHHRTATSALHARRPPRVQLPCALGLRMLQYILVRTLAGFGLFLHLIVHTALAAATCHLLFSTSITMQRLIVAGVTCLALFYPFVVAKPPWASRGSQRRIVLQRFTVHDDCPNVSQAFQEASVVLQSGFESYEGLFYTKAQLESRRAKNQELRKMTHPLSQNVLKHAHFLTGMTSFDQHQRSE